jgi:uncharacterized protein
MNLIVDVTTISPEGLPLAGALDPASLHLAGDEPFSFLEGQLEGRVDRDEEDTVHVRAQVTARLELSCSRCLEPFRHAIDSDLELFCLPHRAGTEEAAEEVQLTDRDVVVSYYANPRIDLGEMVREEIVLGLPMKHLCRADCRGLCPSCGVNRNISPCACEPAADATSPFREFFGPRSS